MEVFLFYTHWDWLNDNPDAGGWIDFDSGFWDCCDDFPVAGGGNGSDGDHVDGGNGGNDSNDESEDCPCSWEFDPNTSILTVDCPCL